MNKVYQHNRNIKSTFRKSIKDDYNRFIMEQSGKYPINDCIKVDMHCHDYNSNVPDELWGRILKLPETWLKTKDLVKVINSNKCTLVTITNHNNARSY